MQIRMLASRFAAGGALSYVAGSTYEVADDLALQFIGDNAAVEVSGSRAVATSTQRDEFNRGAEGRAAVSLVSEYEIPPDEFTDAVTLTATGVVHGMPGRLSAVTVLSGTCDLALADGAGAGTSGIRTIATYAGLTAGELIPFPGDGLPFVNALLATITGTATLRFEVI